MRCERFARGVFVQGAINDEKTTMKKLRLFFCELVCVLVLMGSALQVSADAAPADWDAAAQKLATGDFSEKVESITTLQATRDPRVLQIFTHLSDGELYLLTAQSRIVFRTANGDKYDVIDAVTGAALGTVTDAELESVSVNNALRRQLRGALGGFKLISPDAAVRKAAAQDLVTSVDATLLPQIKTALDAEKDDDIRETLTLAKSLIEINSEDPATRLSALDGFNGILKPEVVATLEAVVAKDEAGNFREADTNVRKRAHEILNDTHFKLDFYKIVENLFFGASLGSVLLLAAVGLAITFGVMGVINMAHGEMIMLGAYTTYVVQLLMPDALEYSLFVAIPAAFLVSGLVGVAIERGVIRFLYGRPLETLLATFGISLVLQQAVRSIFSPLNRSVATPQWMSGSWEINGALSLTYNRLYIVIFGLLVLAGLSLLLRKTMFGLQMRAVTQNRAMARSMGIRSGWVDAMTFGLGSGIAGIAGVALSQLTNVGPNLGQSYIIDSFMVVVFGGVGNLLGTFFAAMSLGVANKVLEPWSGAVVAKILMLVFIILFIQKRPRGMFAQKGRAVEN
jgi:urea transport system permease protein